MAKKTTNIKKNNKNNNKEPKTITKTVELNYKNIEKGLEYNESTNSPILDEGECVISKDVEVFVEEECTNPEYITNINDILDVEKPNTFENLSMDLLLKYKEAIVSLIKDNQHLSEINKGYDYYLYTNAVGKISKLNRYLIKINSVIENKIFEIEIE